jgi:hypothetical protein
VYDVWKEGGVEMATAWINEMFEEGVRKVRGEEA